MLPERRSGYARNFIVIRLNRLNFFNGRSASYRRSETGEEDEIVFQVLAKIRRI